MNRTLGTCLRLMWAAAAAFTFPGWISAPGTGFSNHWFSAAVFGLVFLLLQFEGKQGEGRRDTRRAVFTHIAGFWFAAFTAFGRALEVSGGIPFRGLILPIAVWTHVLGAGVSALWRGLEKADRAEGKAGADSILLRRRWFIPAVLLICWLPAFLAEFPGGVRYDATLELGQVLRHDGFRGDFPLLHTVAVTVPVYLGHLLTGSYDTGIAAYVILQMILMAAMYTHMLRTFLRRGVHRGVVLWGFAWCALFPVIQILAVQELRDVMFAALFTYGVFCLYLLCAEKERILKSPWKSAGCAVVLSLAALSRNNNAGIAFLALVAAVNGGIWLANRKQYLRGATVWAVSGIGSFLLIGGALALLCQPMVRGASDKASLAPMSQAVVRTYLARGDEWTEGEKQELNRLMDLEGIRYVPGYGDPTRDRIRHEVKAGEYAAFALKMGLKYPGEAAEALLAQTRGLWNPGTILRDYKDYFTEEGQPYSEYEKNYYAIQETNEEPIGHANLLPGVLNFYKRIGLMISFERIPGVSMLFSVGAQGWLMLNLFLYLWYRKKRGLLLPAGAMLAYMAGNAFVPIVLLRYFAAAFLCHPMIAAFTLQPEKAGEGTGENETEEARE